MPKSHKHRETRTQAGLQRASTGKTSPETPHESSAKEVFGLESRIQGFGCGDFEFEGVGL